MLSCSIWFYAPSFWMGGGLESRCVGRVFGADVVSRHHSQVILLTYSQLDMFRVHTFIIRSIRC